MASLLDEIVKSKREEISLRKSFKPLSSFSRMVGLTDGSFCDVLKHDRVSLVAELKPRSPSAGVLSESLDIQDYLSSYNRYANAISVLTDEKYFGGSLDLLRTVAKGSSLPLLCKDFIIDPYQCYEARAAGAQAVLIIVKILHDDALAELSEVIQQLGMTPVVEVQNTEELGRALKLDPPIILINNRNLTTFAIDLSTTSALAPQVPGHVVTISASGIESREDIEFLLPYAKNFLIGSVLMKSNDPGAKLRELLAIDDGVQEAQVLAASGAIDDDSD